MEWLANVSIKWVLIAVGLLVLARAVLRTTVGNRHLRGTACEFIESALVAVVTVFLVIRPYFFQAYFIPSESMHPTLLESDRILVNKLAPHTAEPKRGDILVFRPPAEAVPDQKDYIKRVIGLPGDTLEVVPRRILVDGKPLMLLTSESASQMMKGSFRPEQEIGFTYPLNDGEVSIDDRLAIIRSGLDDDIKVAVYGPRDRARVEATYVFLNEEPLLSFVFGPLTTSHDLTQWGGDPGLEGTVYSVNGTPRLVLVRGKKLTLDPGHVLLNNRRMSEPYIAEDPEYVLPPVKIPPAHLFMLGDNRNHSFDSHAWGPLPAKNLVGRAEVLFWPPHRFRFIHRD